MKKIFSLIAIAATVLMASCSKDALDVAENLGGGNNETEVHENLVKGTSYISVALNTPTETGMGTRAENDEFDDGLAAEYRVREAVLVLFEQKGTNEKDYTFFGAYTIPVNPQLYTPVNDQITSRGVSAIKISNLQNNIYALVVANPNGILKVTSEGLDINVDGAHKPVVKGTNTFGDFTSDFATVLSSTNNMLNNDGMSQDGLLITMCNTPYVKGAKGGIQAATGEVLTLAKVDHNKLFATEQLALASDAPSAEIFLERAVAKVTLKAAGGQMVGTSDLAHKFEVKGWLLDNTNASSYLVRNVDGASDYFGYASEGTTSTNSKYRFVGYRPFSYDAAAPAPGTEAMYRYYWAKDPNYSTNGSFNKVTFEEGKSNAVKFLEIDETRPQYCFENTFDIQHQIWSETTRVLIRAQFNGGKTFYTINKDDSEIYGSTQDLEAYLAGRVLFYMNEMSIADRLKVTTEINETNWQTYFTISLQVDETTQIVTPTVTLTADGEAVIENYNAGPGTEAQTKARTAVNEVFSDVRAENTNIQRYVSGLCYYQARIKHFGDDVTPWNSWETGAGKPTSGNTSTIYPNVGEDSDKKNYLGRYGVVRNNWYALNVTAVKHIGSPVIPSITPGADGDTPDDELDSYISIRINIMSWAKRAQDIEF